MSLHLPSMHILEWPQGVPSVIFPKLNVIVESSDLHLSSHGFRFCVRRSTASHFTIRRPSPMYRLLKAEHWTSVKSSLPGGHLSVLHSLYSDSGPEQLVHRGSAVVSKLLIMHVRALLVTPPPQVLLQGDQ